MSQFLSHSAEETEDFGFRLAQQLKGGEVIAMYGGMGMGKTAFTRGLARGLGIEHGISSPTFALVHEHTKAAKAALTGAFEAPGFLCALADELAGRGN